MKCVKVAGIERENLRVFAVKVSFAFLKEEELNATVEVKVRKESALYA